MVGDLGGSGSFREFLGLKLKELQYALEGEHMREIERMETDMETLKAELQMRGVAAAEAVMSSEAVARCAEASLAIVQQIQQFDGQIQEVDLDEFSTPGPVVPGLAIGWSSPPRIQPVAVSASSPGLETGPVTNAAVLSLDTRAAERGAEALKELDKAKHRNVALMQRLQEMKAPAESASRRQSQTSLEDIGAPSYARCGRFGARTTDLNSGTLRQDHQVKLAFGDDVVVLSRNVADLETAFLVYDPEDSGFVSVEHFHLVVSSQLQHSHGRDQIQKAVGYFTSLHPELGIRVKWWDFVGTLARGNFEPCPLK